MKKFSPLASCIILLALPLFAQPPANDGRPVPPLVKVLDADGDGIISAAEIANAPAVLKTLDKNGDGKLTPDEFRPPHPLGGPGPRGAAGSTPTGHRPPHQGSGSTQTNGGPGGQGGPGNPPPRPPLEAALDADGDGIISAAEILNASAALLTLDRNGDGQLTKDEFAPPPPPGGPGGNRPPPPAGAAKR